MRPGVVANLVTFPCCALQDFGMLRHILADDKKGGVDVMLPEQIQQPRRQFFAWTVIEGECDVGAIDVHRADRCFLFRDRRWFWLCRRGGGRGRGLLGQCNHRRNEEKKCAEFSQHETQKRDRLPY